MSVGAWEGPSEGLMDVCCAVGLSVVGPLVGLSVGLEDGAWLGMDSIVGSSVGLPVDDACVGFELG